MFCECSCYKMNVLVLFVLLQYRELHSCESRVNSPSRKRTRVAGMVYLDQSLLLPEVQDTSGKTATAAGSEVGPAGRSGCLDGLNSNLQKSIITSCGL